MITFSQVCFGYHGHKLLDRLSFTIDKGEFVALIGPNGAGKSTLSKLFNGLLVPTSGTVLVDHQDTRKTKTSTFAKSIGFLMQNPDSQICQNTVREELAFGLNCAGIAPAQTAQRVENMLARFGFDGAASPFQLSRSERQLIALASLIILQPQILILDEPTTGLDYRECMYMMHLIRKLHEDGATIIMISHDMEIVQDFASRVLVLDQGRIVADGSVRDVFADTAMLRAASLLPSQLVSLCQALDIEPCFSADALADYIEDRVKRRQSI